MPGAVRNEFDLLLIAFPVGSWLQFIEDSAELLHQVNIAQLGVAADGIGFADSAAGHNSVEGFHVILYKNPVADIFSVSVYRNGRSAERLTDNYRNQLLGELIGAIIVGAICDKSRQAVSVCPSAYQVVGGGLTGGVRLAWIVWSAFGKEALRTE